MTSSRSLLTTLILGMLFFQSCMSDPKPHPNQAKGANFAINEIKGSSEIAELYTGFSLPSKRLFNFQTCLKDTSDDKSLLGGLTFGILIDEKEIPVETQEDGCISWSEQISYNYLADAKYITLKRTLISRNRYRGRVDFEVAINPWQHDEGSSSPAVLDPRYQKSIPILINSAESMSALSGDLSGKQTISPIIVEEARLVISEKRMTDKGVVLSLEVVTQPLVQLRGMDGQLYQKKLMSGQFQLNAKIISSMDSEDSQDRIQLSYDTNPVSVKMRDGRLVATMDLTLPYVPTRGQLELWLSIAPENGPPGMIGTEGIYHLGEYHQIKGTPFVRLKPFMFGNTANFDIKDYVTGNATTLTEDSPYFVKAQYVFDPLTIRFVRYGTETATEREVIFTAYTCVTNALDSRRARAFEFTVNKIQRDKNGERVKEKVRTLDNGCFQWTDSITHKYFVRERLMVDEVFIVNSELAINQNIGIAINPWDFGFTFGRDTRLMNKADLTDESYLQKPASEFYLNGFNYTTVGVDFEIDSLLNLTLYRRIVFRIDPFVLRYHSMTAGRNGIERLRDGVYLLKLAIQRNGYEDPEKANEYISSVEKLVRVISNQIITPVEFGFSDVRLLGSRNNILIELATVKEELVNIMANGEVEPKSPVNSLDVLIDKDSGLAPKTFIGPIILHHEDDGKAVMASSNQSLLELLSETTRRSREQIEEEEQKAIEDISTMGAPDITIAPSPITATELIRTGKAKLSEERSTAQELSKIETFLFENDLLPVDINKDHDTPLVQALVKEGTTTTPREGFLSALQTGTLNKDQIHQLCDFWFKEHIPGLFTHRKNVFYLPESELVRRCIQESNRRDGESMFVLERRLHVEEVGPNRYMRGFALNFNFGTGFGLSRGASQSISHSFSWNNDLGLGFSTPYFKVGTSAGYRLSKNFDENQGSQVRVDISSTTFLITEQNDFEIVLNKYKQCMGIKLNPNYFVGKDAPWRSLWSRDLTGPERAFSVTAGYYICDDEIVDEPTVVKERYYYLSQHFAVGHLQDSRDLRNRQFLLSLRGIRDHAMFLNEIKAQPYTPNTPETSSFDQQLPLDALYPVFQLQKYHPTHPGTYQILPSDVLTK